MTETKRGRPRKTPEKPAERPALPDGVIRWERPSGRVLDTNDSQDTIEYAESQGWKRVE